MIRKSAFLLILIICGLISIFTWLFIDTIIQKTLETGFARYLKTDVVIEELRTSVLDMGIGFEKLQIKDPDNGE